MDLSHILCVIYVFLNLGIFPHSPLQLINVSPTALSHTPNEPQCHSARSIFFL